MRHLTIAVGLAAAGLFSASAVTLPTSSFATGTTSIVIDNDVVSKKKCRKGSRLSKDGKRCLRVKRGSY
ncbi:MAG: hypothetical protein AAFQ42_01185 [Pseudomonadota bacterium]